MTLSQIIEATARRMTTVAVNVVSNYGTVTITDLEDNHADIFLQGDDACAFISERDELWNRTGDLSKSTIELHLAEPYTVLWE